MDGFDDEVSPAEAARERRRDRDADANARAGMRTGLAKQFKQVLDTQVKRAREPEAHSGDRHEPRGDAAEDAPRSRGHQPRPKP
jgi:3-mercaptopyruvate sulfurtransferase SseA